MRPCGPCTACCTTLIINEPQLVSPAGSTCPHVCAGGCAIHGPRQPESCRTFYCNYTINPDRLSDAERPDRVGAIVEIRHNPDKAPPLQRTTHVVACAPDGLDRILENSYWSALIGRDFAAGIPILTAQHDDPLNREVLGLRQTAEGVFCRLTSCARDGAPVLTTLQPVHDPPIPLALLIPDQGFMFDARRLVRLLGQRAWMVVTTGVRSADAQTLHFLFTRRQAQWITRLVNLQPAAGPDKLAAAGAACD